MNFYYMNRLELTIKANFWNPTDIIFNFSHSILPLSSQ